MRLKKADKAANGRLTGVFGDLLVRRFSVRQPEMFRVIESISSKSSPLDKAALCELAQTVMDLDFDGIEGDLIHAGRKEEAAVPVIEKAKRRSRPFLILEPPYENVSPEGDIALAHLDEGGHDRMRALLERLAPRLVPGGRLIIDDHKKDGCRQAVDEYFRGKRGFGLEKKSRLHAVRN